MIDLSGMRRRYQEELVRDLRWRLLERSRTPRMIIFEEADAWAPQTRSSECKEAVEALVRRGRQFALADMDYVYKNCKHGLIENIRFLYRMMADLWARGYKVFAVGKAYDDDLYAWVDGGERDTEYEGLKVAVFKAPERVEDFERFSYGLEMVSLSVVDEALRGMGVDGE